MVELNKIDRFLLEYPENNSMYKTAIKQFFKVIGENPETYFDDMENYDYKSDIHTFRRYLKDKAPKTIRGYISVVRNFLIKYEVELPDIFWKGITRKIKGKGAITRYKIPNNKQLKQILQYANVKYKALFLMLSSSGMRVGEIIQLKLTDIDMETNTIYLKAGYTKTGELRTTFFTPETKDALQEWLKQRDDDLQRMIKRTLNFQARKTPNDDRLFPVKYESINFCWRRLLRKAGYDEKDETSKITRMTVHTLRKYFRSRLALETSADVVEALLGHTEGMNRIYRHYSDDDLREEYEKGRHKLYVFETEVADERIQDLEEKITQGKKETDILREKVELLARYRSVFEGEFDMNGEETLEALISIDKGLAEVGKKEKTSAKKEDFDLLTDEKAIKLRKRLKENRGDADGKFLPIGDRDNIQVMKKQMKDMMKKIEELEGE